MNSLGQRKIEPWLSLKSEFPISPRDGMRLANSLNRPVAHWSILGLLRPLQSLV